MSKWWFTGLALLLFAAVGCDIVATTFTSREFNAPDDNEQVIPVLQDQKPLGQADQDDGESLDPTTLSDQVLTPVTVPDTQNKADPGRDSQPVPGADPTFASNEMGSPAEGYDSQPAPTRPYEPTSPLPDATPKQTPNPTLAPTPHVDESVTGEAPNTAPNVKVSETMTTTEPLRDCIRSGGMTLWLESQGGEFATSTGEIVVVNLCLSNLSVDLAWFDLMLNLENAGKAEFREISMGGFSLESYSELPTESVRIRAIDFNQKLIAGTDGILLATLRVAGTGVGESPLTIEVIGIHDKDKNSVEAQVLQASLQVTEK